MKIKIPEEDKFYLPNFMGEIEYNDPEIWHCLKNKMEKRKVKWVANERYYDYDKMLMLIIALKTIKTLKIIVHKGRQRSLGIRQRVILIKTYIGRTIQNIMIQSSAVT